MRLPGRLAKVLAGGLAPAIGRWAAAQEGRILREGRPLNEELGAFAETLGIRDVDGIRVMVVSPIPLPVAPWVARCAGRLGLPVFAPAGMALGRGIYLLPGCDSSLAHELAHVLQYQRFGGIAPFMREYLRQCLADGYPEAELEIEARDVACGFIREA